MTQFSRVQGHCVMLWRHDVSRSRNLFLLEHELNLKFLKIPTSFTHKQQILKHANNKKGWSILNSILFLNFDKIMEILQ